jgi:hypothetical protein
MPNRMSDNLYSGSLKRKVAPTNVAARNLQDFLDPAIVSRGMVAPWGRDKQGVGQWAVPGIVAGAIKAIDQTGEAMRLPPNTSPDHPAYKGVFDVAGAINMPALLRKGATSTLGMNLWHGGPNKWAAEPGFPQGRPRLDKMGSGEGNQAYGHGFYSAQKPEVAQTYKTPEGSYQRLSGHLEPKTEFAFDLMERGYGTSKIMEMMLGKYGNKVKFEEVVKSIDDAKKVGAGQGSLYKIDIPDEDIAKYLDWDAPLSEQTDALAKIKQHWSDTIGDPDIVMDRLGISESSTGKELYQALGGIMQRQQAASEALGKAGIPGNRYADQMSRGKYGVQLKYKGKDYTDGPVEFATKKQADDYLKESTKKGFEAEHIDIGTRNYVTWDQKVLDRAKVLQRNEEIYKQLEKSGVPFA